MNNPDLIALGRSLMESAHKLIFIGGALGVVSILAGQVSRRFGAPLLLVLLGIGMLAGEDGVLGIGFDNFYDAYLIGSIALGVILFEGGLKTHPRTIRIALWPAIALATAGVAITAAIVGATVVLIGSATIAGAMLAGAAAAPTDAAAVAGLLRGARVRVPERVLALLEVELGLNDPMSVFLTVLLIHVLSEPAWLSFDRAALLLVREMAGGAVLGLAGGWALAWSLRRLQLERSLATVLALTAGLALFGLAQMLGASGFLAIYLAGILIGASEHHAREDVEHFFEGLAWLAQIALFLMLGLLVTPHVLPPYVVPAIGVAAVLIFVARPVAVFVCLLPFGFTWREIAFASWVGLRGAVPIYLSFIPALADPARDARLFASIFVLVIASVAVQGTTIALVARLLGYARESEEAPIAEQILH